MRWGLTTEARNDSSAPSGFDIDMSDAEPGNSLMKQGEKLMNTRMDWVVRSLVAVAFFVSIAHSGVGEAKVRCNKRQCTTIGGMEVTLSAFDKWREGSKLNILKTRRKVGKAGARVTLTNYYFRGGSLYAPNQSVTVTGRDAKQVKLRGWDGRPINGASIAIGGDFVCGGGGVCNLRPSGSVDLGGNGGNWDGVIAIADVTLNGDHGYVCAVAGTTSEYWMEELGEVCRNTPAAISELQQTPSAPLDPIGPNMAYAWVNDPTKSTSLASYSYSYNPSGERVEVQRYQKGRWKVSFPGWDPEGAHTAQVTAYGTAGAQCSAFPVSLGAIVECTDVNGQLIDTRFSLLASAVQVDAYAWVLGSGSLVSGSSPLVIPQSLDEEEGSNVEQDYENIVVYKFGTGTYLLNFVDYAEAVRPLENAIVTPAYYLNPAGTRCSIGAIVGDLVSVVCHSTAGVLVDASFMVLATGSPTDAYGWSASPEAALSAADVDRSNAPELVIDGAENPVLILRQDVGRYQVYFHELADFSGGGNVQVSQVGFDGDRICGVRWWSSDDAYVSCTDSNGAYADSEFTVRYTKPSLAEKH